MRNAKRKKQLPIFLLLSFNPGKDKKNEKELKNEHKELG
jgi:hypothetical protein